MPRLSIRLKDEQHAFVEALINAGKYENASEVMRDAVRSLQHCIQADELTLDLLRTQLQAGLDALENGHVIEVDNAV